MATRRPDIGFWHASLHVVARRPRAAERDVSPTARKNRDKVGLATGDDKETRRGARVFVVVSRDTLFKTTFSTVICAPIYTRGQGLTTQVEVGTPEGLKHESWIMCDNLTSLRRSDLIGFVGSLSLQKIQELDRALRSALDLL